MEGVFEASQDGEGLLGRDDDGPVRGCGARLDGEDGIFFHAFVEDSDLVDAAHDAPHFRDRGPGKVFLGVKRLQPALNIEGLISSAVSSPQRAMR